jgi:hypothetical protein
MTGNIFVIELKDGRHLKLIVDAYYKTLAGQEQCNDTGSSGGTPGATLQMRWAFLP